MLNLIEFLNIIDCEKVYFKVYHLWMKTEMIQIKLQVCSKLQVTKMSPTPHQRSLQLVWELEVYVNWFLPLTCFILQPVSKS